MITRAAGEKGAAYNGHRDVSFQADITDGLRTGLQRRLL
jgi:hypothetical protein